MAKAKVDFLWYKVGDEVKDEDVQESWVKEGLVESGSSPKPKKESESKKGLFKKKK